MAGFLKSQAYFLPRGLLKLPHPISWYEKKLLPFLPEWRRQARSRGGDKSVCADKFLNEIIPFFIEVVIQDGIYFVRDFPEHEFSKHLCVSTVPIMVKKKLFTQKRSKNCLSHVSLATIMYCRIKLLVLKNGLKKLERKCARLSEPAQSK